MKWQIKKRKDKRNWHKWFAWFPITVQDNRVWLEYVLRQGTFNEHPSATTSFWTYRYKDIC